MNQTPKSPDLQVALFTGAPCPSGVAIPESGTDVFVATLGCAAILHLPDQDIHLARDHWALRTCGVSGPVELVMSPLHNGLVVVIAGVLGPPRSHANISAGNVWSDADYGLVWELLGDRAEDAISLHYARTGCGRTTPLHAHLLGEERFVCLRGAGFIVRGCELLEFAAGDQIVVPPSVPHSVVACGELLEYLCIKAPADPQYTDRLVIDAHPDTKMAFQDRNFARKPAT